MPELNRQAVLDLLQTLPEDATLERIIQALSQVSEASEPAAVVPHPPAVPTPQEVAALLKAPDSPRDALIFRLLYATGMRVGELTRLRFADLNHQDRTLFIRQGKDSIDRWALADEHTFEQLRQAQADRPPEDRVIELEERQIHEVVTHWADAIGLLEKYAALGRHLGPHSFRHAFATHCYANGVDPFTLRHLLGHTDLANTLLYVETSRRREACEYAKFLAENPLR